MEAGTCLVPVVQMASEGSDIFGFCIDKISDQPPQKF
jgi:hypothetical protein